MFKKALQIVVTFGVLVGAYQVYLVAFALLTDRFGGVRVDDKGWVALEGKVAKRAKEYAALAFGAGHWTTDPDLEIRIYDAERGFFMYAGGYERKEKGKKLRFQPFAIVWLNKGGQGMKTAISDEAIVELNEPLGLSKPGAPAMHVVEAKLEHNVILRDDKGTPHDRSDDTVVDGDGAPLPYIEYSEKTIPAEIRTKAHVRVIDPKMTLTGSDLLIYMRKPKTSGGSAGFDAETTYLRKDVKILIADAGKGGVMPGQVRGATSGPTPTTVKAEGGGGPNDFAMRVDLPPKPKALRPDQEGPPEQEGPTYVTFRRNVEVARGIQAPDTLSSDNLRLTLMPAEKRPEVSPLPGGAVIVLGAACFTPGAGGATPRLSSGGDADGPLGSLELRRAHATGFAVWLVSPSQGIETKCNELIYKKQLPALPDETYLRADARADGLPPLFVEKVDRDGTAAEPGPIKAVTHVWSVDATIFDDGLGGSASTVIARGPGKLESRADRDKSKDHEATWSDTLLVKTLPLTKAQLDELAASLPKDKPPPTRREITLTGDPVLIDHTQETTLRAHASVVANLLPRPGGAEAAKDGAAKPGGALNSGSSRIERVIAKEQVVLTAPGKTINARDVLDARFEEVVAMVKGEPAPAAAPSSPNPVVTNAGPAPAAQAKAAPVDDPARKPAPEPAVFVSAHRIWPTLRRLPDGKTELSKAMLRGAVRVHQDPSPDKPRGTDAQGEALDLRSVGPGLMQFHLADAEPTGQGETARLAARDGVKLDARPGAVIVTEDYVFRGHRIHLDQLRDVAWSESPGSLTQMAERGFLNDKGLQKRTAELARMTPEERAKEKSKKSPLTISWKEKMEFHGQTKDPEGRPTGWAMFRGGVNAMSEDYHIIADELDTYTDRPVSLAGNNKKKPAPRSANPDDTPAPEEPKPELVRLEARSRTPWTPEKRGVIALNVRRDEETGQLIERQKIDCGELWYDKRSGKYLVPGAGIVRLSRRSALPPDPRKPGPKQYGDWELTKVAFADKMLGRFGVARNEEQPEPRTADFYGNVATANAVVPDEFTDIDFDRRPPKTRYLTSERLRLVDYPPPKGVKDRAAYQIVTADGGIVQAHDDTTALQGDYIHYDTQKGQFYAYGEEGRTVTMTRQTLVGQEATITRGDAFLYNTKTKETQEINPFQILLVDGKGARLGPAPPPPPYGQAPRVKPPRQPLRPPPRLNTERRDFYGR